MKKVLIASVAILGLLTSASADTRDTLGCNKGPYSYSPSMSPAAIAVHQQVQAEATCEVGKDPSWYVAFENTRTKASKYDAAGGAGPE